MLRIDIKTKGAVIRAAKNLENALDYRTEMQRCTIPHQKRDAAFWMKVHAMRYAAEIRNILSK